MPTVEFAQRPIEERLVEAACIYWSVPREYFHQKSKETTYSYRKSILYYLIRTHCPNMTYNKIAEMFYCKGHSPVLLAISKIDAHKSVYKQTCTDINQITYLADKLTAQLVEKLVTQNPIL